MCGMERSEKRVRSVPRLCLGVCSVEEDALLDSSLGFPAELAVFKSIFSGVLDHGGLAIESRHLHPVLSQSGGLAADQVLDLTHPLWSVQVSHQDFLLDHLKNTECKGDLDGERQSLWD